MTGKASGPRDVEQVRFSTAVDELLDLALETRWKLVHEPEVPADLERLVGEIDGQVARWREQFQANPSVEQRADERLRHAQNIIAECAAILAGRLPDRRRSTDSA